VTRRLPFWVAVLLVSVYAVRAAFGLWGGVAYSKGRRLAALAKFQRALPLLEHSAVGQDRAAALWLTAQVRLGIWHDRLAAQESPESMGELMGQAYREYTEAISLSPASGWYWAGLGDIYHQRERIERFRAGFPLDLLEEDPWAAVGRPGRIAVGMVRIATRREPSVYYLQDQLAFMLFDYKLEAAALATVRRSAMVQPIYRLHAYKDLEATPPQLLDAFGEGARDALGKNPFISRVMHLLALGRIEVRRERFVEAEQYLRSSLDAPGTSINRAEARYYLGLALAAQGRAEEARAALQSAESHPVFEGAGLAARAEIAEGEGRLEEALELLEEARRVEPRKLGHAIAFARVACELRAWNRAEAALRWAAMVHSGDPRPLRSLGLTYVQKGDLEEAREVLRELERLGGNPREALRLQEAIEAAAHE
jgi:tetratricopeptide (TPR) repeat protein